MHSQTYAHFMLCVTIFEMEDRRRGLGACLAGYGMAWRSTWEGGGGNCQRQAGGVAGRFCRNAEWDLRRFSAAQTYGASGAVMD